MQAVLRNLLQYGDLSFRDFVEVALYHPDGGYYTRPLSPVGKGGDYVTSPTLSPVFAFALGRLIDEFVSRCEGGVPTIVDVGCRDGKLIRELAREGAFFAGVDRALQCRAAALSGPDVEHRDGAAEGSSPPFFTTNLHEVPKHDAQLIISNELFDALPFARLVQRGEHLHELWVTQDLDWTEHEAAAAYDDYFAARGLELQDGQFADVSLDWEATYADLADYVERGLIVTFDYGHPENKLFDPRARRFGTAAAYSQQRVTRDLLSNPGEQDLTAHINFTDLIRAGEARGFRTLFFDRQAKFLLSLGITEHPLFAPVQDVGIGSVEEGISLIEQREEARRLVLPDSIGHDIRVLVQEKGLGGGGWSFQRRLF